MIKVYFDAGGYNPELKEMEKKGLIEAIYFPYENIIRKIKKLAPPSKVSWNEMDNFSWEVVELTWKDSGEVSNKFEEIEELIGKNNKTDIKHLDSAYREKCEAFITEDKKDIYSKRKELHELLNISVFLQSNLEEFKEFCRN